MIFHPIKYHQNKILNFNYVIEILTRTILNTNSLKSLLPIFVLVQQFSFLF